MKDGEKTKIEYVKPLEKYFKNKGETGDHLVSVGMLLPIFVKNEYPETGGIYSYYEGFKFPRKTLPDADASYANDAVKRITMFFFNSFSSRAFILPAAAFAILPWRVKSKAIESVLGQWNRIGSYFFSKNFLDDNRYCDTCQELRKIVDNFFVNLGVNREVAALSAEIAICMIQYDDAYRYRLEDIFSVLSYERIMEDPRQAIKDGFEVFAKRETVPHVTWKMRNMVNIVSAALLFPKVKRAFRKAFENCDYKVLALDEADKYHTLLWPTYLFQGLTIEDRIKIYDQHHPNKSYPPLLQLIKR